MEYTKLIIVLLTSLSTLFAIWLKNYYDIIKLKNKANPVSRECKSKYYIEMDRICSIIRTALSSNSVYIAYFHNGGSFGNGIAMDKFTVVGEDYAYDSVYSYKRNYTNTMVNHISYAYHKLITKGRYKADIGSIVHDLSFKQDLIGRNNQSIAMYIIKDPTNDLPIGFIAIEFANINSDIEESVVWKHTNHLYRLLNMSVKINDNGDIKTNIQ